MLGLVKTSKKEYKLVKDFGTTKDGGKSYLISAKNNAEFDLQVWTHYARITSRKNHKVTWEGDSKKLKMFKQIESL